MPMKQLLLNGRWLLRGTGAVNVPEMPAEVPGNIELDLYRNGIIPDPFFGENVDLLRPYEFNNWVYERNFELPADFPAHADLVFDGIDCLAEILVNGRTAGKADNAFLRHRFAVDDLLRRGETNTVTVRIESPILAVKDIPLDHHSKAQAWNFESLRLRKPAHSYGWDIAPRMILGGLWRDVRLEERPDHALQCCYFCLQDTQRTGEKQLCFSWSFRTSLNCWDQFDLDVTGRCGESEFHFQRKAKFTSGFDVIPVRNPKLWYPAGYGEQNLYDVEIRVSHRGEELFTAHRTIGIRSVKLEYDETPEHFKFRFRVNDIPIMVKGSNWVPADALHSRDRERTIPILELFRELGCNMLRVWGGGVYESPEFYDYCDRHGIMIWQDFMTGCAFYPMDEEFMGRFRTEVEQIVLELRQHPALILWAGDNEVDQFAAHMHDGRKPSHNRLTRELIPQVLHRLDPARPYLPSSPYISPAVEARGQDDLHSPEQHVWGPRDYFKSPFYAANPAAFISETGYHGAPAVESLRKFLSPEKLWPGHGNAEWIAHCTTPVYTYRIELMYRQIREFFGIEPQTIEEFVAASQIVQAEAKKFFVENVRAHKWRKSGILWWNVMDCWPQFSDAVVDYYFNRKLAFDYIRRSQKPLQVILGEWTDWGHRVIVTNDTLAPVKGSVTVSDADTGETLFDGNFEVPANANAEAGRFDLPNGEQRLLLLRFEAGTLSGANHYLTGHPPYSLEQYLGWREKIAALG